VSTPRVSVVIGTHNRSRLVEQAIRSVLAQTFADLEVVVCDDGSNDDTGARVRGFGAPVRYLRLEHSGRLGVPRNRGVEAARGDLLAFLDDDDLWEPEKLARQVARLDGDPSLDAVYTDRRLLFDDGTISAPAPSPEPDAEGRLLDRALCGDFPHPCTLLIRRVALDRAGGFDETLETGEDVALWLRVGRVARVARIAEPLALIRRRTGSLSDHRPAVTFGNALALLERELSAGDLGPRRRLRCRRTIAFLNAQLARALLERGERAEAIRAALRGVAWFPASRNAWRALVAGLLGRTASSGPQPAAAPRDSSS
jgi:glycosyltransferase involved in cell wall biosynthesis